MMTVDIGNLFDMIDGVYSHVQNMQNNSLTRYSKTTSVVSRVYIEDNLVDEDIMVPLMGTLNQTYIGFVLCALQLNNVIGQYSVVRDAIARVATESMDGHLGAIADFGSMDEIAPSNEAVVLEIDKRVQHLATGKIIEFDFLIGDIVERSTTVGNADAPKKDRDITRFKSTKEVPTTITVPIHVSLLPNVVSSSVADAFLSLNFEESFSRRWTKWRAGEISLFGDLLFSFDLVKKFKRALNDDKGNALASMLSEKNRNRMRQYKSIISAIKHKNTDSMHNNIASSMIVFDKRTFDRAVIDSDLDFSKVRDRQRFFNAALAMIVCVVDQMHEIVTIYFNGMDQYSEASYRLIKTAGSGKDGVNITDLMDSIAKGNAPRF